jgi:hypothetical protein
MRKTFIIATAIAAFSSAPVLAQAHGGGPGGGHGGGPGGGMGAGPPITPPGRDGGMGAMDRAHDIANQRGEFGRTFAEQQRMNADQHRLQAQQYQMLAQQRRAEAMATAQVARSGRMLTDEDGKRIRSALKQDMEAWRDAFRVGRSDWQAMRDQWLVDRASLSPQQWAEQRARWFAARDAWIANQRTMASNRRR